MHASRYIGLARRTPSSVRERASQRPAPPSRAYRPREAGIVQVAAIARAPESASMRGSAAAWCRPTFRRNRKCSRQIRGPELLVSFVWGDRCFNRSYLRLLPEANGRKITRHRSRPRTCGSATSPARKMTDDKLDSAQTSLIQFDKKFRPGSSSRLEKERPWQRKWNRGVDRISRGQTHTVRTRKHNLSLIQVS